MTGFEKKSICRNILGENVLKTLKLLYFTDVERRSFKNNKTPRISKYSLKASALIGKQKNMVCLYT